jgi:hypothetical protein
LPDLAKLLDRFRPVRRLLELDAALELRARA